MLSGKEHLTRVTFVTTCDVLVKASCEDDADSKLLDKIKLIPNIELTCEDSKVIFKSIRCEDPEFEFIGEDY